MSASPEYFLTSNGSNEIVYRDQQFNIAKSIKARVNGFPLNGINDIAWTQGCIFCNVLSDNNIYAICENSGKVLYILDCSDLAKKGGVPGKDHVLNGIAYDRQTNSLFITGKRWGKYFQIRPTHPVI